MVIKYKAKYIRDGAVVIDDTALIELGSSQTDGDPAASNPQANSNNAWSQMIAESEERLKEVDQNIDSASDDSASDSSTRSDSRSDDSTRGDSTHADK